MIVSLRFEINPVPNGGNPAAGALLEDQRTGWFWNAAAGGWQGGLPAESDPAFAAWLVPLVPHYPLAGIWGHGPRPYPDFTGVGATWAAYPYDLGGATPARIPGFALVLADAYQLGTGGGSAGR